MLDTDASLLYADHYATVFEDPRQWFEEHSQFLDDRERDTLLSTSYGVHRPDPREYVTQRALVRRQLYENAAHVHELDL